MTVAFDTPAEAPSKVKIDDKDKCVTYSANERWSGIDTVIRAKNKLTKGSNKSPLQAAFRTFIKKNLEHVNMHRRGARLSVNAGDIALVEEAKNPKSKLTTQAAENTWYQDDEDEERLAAASTVHGIIIRHAFEFPFDVNAREFLRLVCARFKFTGLEVPLEELFDSRAAQDLVIYSFWLCYVECFQKFRARFFTEVYSTAVKELWRMMQPRGNVLPQEVRTALHFVRFSDW